MKKMEDKYQECIDEFVATLSNQFEKELSVIILHGGLVRESSPIKYWSDIDLITVFKYYDRSITKYLSKIIHEFEIRFNIRLDINLVYQYDFNDDFHKSKYYNSEIINALNLRSAKVLYGSLNAIDSTFFNERESVFVYLVNTQNLFRRYYIENVYCNLDSINCKIYLQRIIRWVFSIIRSSLRLYDVFVNPYQDSLNELIKINCLSQQNISLIETLIRIRSDFANLDTSDIAYFEELFTRIEDFIESYVNKTISIFSMK
jgi:hypothetical protein